MSASETIAAELDARFPGTREAAVGTADGNEFVIFTKPELGRRTGEALAAVWDLLAERLGAYAVSVHRAAILTGAELEATGVMAQHYGVINEISRLGRSALTEPAEAALVATYGDRLEGAEVLGGHQFLAAYGDVSPYALGLLFANGDVQRLGAGTYAAEVKVDGTPVIILNGFHPRQLSFFTAEDTVCAFLHASSPTAWATLRADLIGTTDPAKADAASIRGRLFADPAAYGLETVSYNFNGVHMSAGPLEGLAELQRFFGAGHALTDWTFARRLADDGLDAARVEALTANPTIGSGDQQGTAFDLTEGLDAADAAAVLAR